MSMPTDVAAKLPTLRILPRNSASESKGSIHDDEKAREMGYKGGLVPGVTVLGYMSRLMQESFGERWQSGSSARRKTLVICGWDRTGDASTRRPITGRAVTPPDGRSP